MKPCGNASCSRHDVQFKSRCDLNSEAEMADCSAYFPKKEGSALGNQVGGDHYKKMKIQPLEYIHKNDLNFCQGNIVKYITRYKEKNGKEDLEKVKHYVDLLIELEYGDG